MIAVASAGLIYGGVKVEDIASVPSLVAGVLIAIEAVVTFIQGITTKSE